MPQISAMTMEKGLFSSIIYDHILINHKHVLPLLLDINWLTEESYNAEIALQWRPL